MKKLLFLLGIVALFSCEEKEPECWICDEIHRLELSNNAYSRDTTIVSKNQFTVCGDEERKREISERESVEEIEHMELQGTVFYWTGTKYIEVECKKWR